MWLEHQWQNSAIASKATFLFLPHYDAICNLFNNYIITQVILAFWLVFAYDLLEDRRTIDVIITKFFPAVFKNGGKFWEFR